MVTPLRDVSRRVDSPIRYPEIDLSALSLRTEIVEEPSPSPSTAASASGRGGDDVLYVAVGKDVKESGPTLIWSLHNSRGRKICVLHVHTPAQKIPIMGTKFSINQLERHQVMAYHEMERQDTQKIMDKFIRICDKAGVQAEKLLIEMDSIEKGIVELISQHDIRHLVMGAAANKQYSRRMTELKSKKAVYVREQAPVFCHIWFICKGHLIYTRQGRPNEVHVEGVPPLLLDSPASCTERTGSLISVSVTEERDERLELIDSFQDNRRESSDNHGVNLINPTPPDVIGWVTSQCRLNVEGSRDEWNGPRSPSVVSRFSTCSSGEMVENSALVSFPKQQKPENRLEYYAQHHYVDENQRSSPHSGENVIDELYNRLEQYMTEADNAKGEAYGESIRRKKAEKDAIDAMRRAQASETMYAKELRQRREIEEAVSRGKEEVEKMKQQLNGILEELQIAQEQKLSLQCQIANSEKMVEELEQKMFSAVELLKKFKKERDELQMERDNAVRLAEELANKQVQEASSPSISRFFAEFSFSEIQEATHNFDPSLKIGEGGYGIIYRGLLRHTQVAIKMLHPRSLQGPLEFQTEVDILSKLRHPNLVTLIGACPEAWSLVYEYLPNGSLEDRLSCKDNTPPLPWQTRIRIATELCSILIFLHSCSPHGIVHSDLKPANVLLDANYVSKLSDFGICRVLRHDEFSDNNTSLCCRSDPKGTFAYMDPELLSTGELTPKSDVYSFGVILLRLLTGRPALGITKEVQYAIDKGNLKDLLDQTAGDWPFVQAKQLAHLALRCCEMNRRCRPELSSEVWKVLEPMRASCGGSSLRMGSEERCEIPSYFICPIFQEVMQDPVVAADGFTYEAEALRGWLDSGHDTSPMTNLKLAHNNLVQNHALRSAIQEWLQQP